MNKVPFGFRQDVEPDRPEPEDEKQQEISNTNIHMEKTWSPVVQAPASPRDTKWRR